MNDTKNCPYCGEEIKMKAQKCRHCGEWLVDKPKLSTTDTTLPSEKEEASALEWITVGLALVLSVIETFWIPIAIGICAALFVPDSDTHLECIQDEVIDCTRNESNALMSTLGLDELNGLTNLMIGDQRSRNIVVSSFNEQNQIKVDESWFWSTAKIYNRIHPKGKIVSFGILGMVFPLIEWEDFALLYIE